MLPYPTDPRRLLIMVRVFLHEFCEFVRAHDAGLEYPSPEGDPCADHQLEAFLERLAVDAAQIDESAAIVESETEIRRGLVQHLADLVSRPSRCSRRDD